MTVLELHIRIERGLHNNGVLAYAGSFREEYDLDINRCISRIVEDVLSGKTGLHDKLQITKDDLSPLRVLDQTLAVGANPRGFEATLPGDYNHLINDRSVVSFTCDGEVQTKQVPNRLIRDEYTYNLQDNELGKSIISSPISTLSLGKLVILAPDFTVSGVKIDYYRNPVLVDFNNPANGAGVLEFSNTTMFKFIDYIVEYVAGILEESAIKQQALIRELPKP